MLTPSTIMLVEIVNCWFSAQFEWKVKNRIDTIIYFVYHTLFIAIYVIHVFPTFISSVYEKKNKYLNMRNFLLDFSFLLKKMNLNCARNWIHCVLKRCFDSKFRKNIVSIDVPQLSHHTKRNYYFFCYVLFWSRTLIPLHTYIYRLCVYHSIPIVHFKQRAKSFIFFYIRLYALLYCCKFRWKGKPKIKKNDTIMSIWDSLTGCFWFSPENQRNTFASILAGVLVNLQISCFKTNKADFFSYSIKWVTNLSNVFSRKKMITFELFC